MGPPPHTGVQGGPCSTWRDGAATVVPGNGVGALCGMGCDRGAQSLPGVVYVWKGTPGMATEVWNSSNRALLPAAGSRGRRQRRRGLCCQRWWKHSW